MKRNLMMRAHELARNLEGDYRARMSLALRQAWKEEKEMEMVKLVGTEKQVAWAEDIRRENIEYLEKRIQNFERRAAATGQEFPEVIAHFNQCITEFKTLDKFASAKWWIEHRNCGQFFDQSLMKRLQNNR